MNSRTFLLLKTLIILLFMGFSAKAQRYPLQDEVQAVHSFPAKCVGTWKGMMYIYAYGNLRDSVQVELSVVKIDDNAWKWRTDYISEKMPVTKDYIMRRDPKSAHIFLLDEGDGVVLTNYLTGTKLYSNFETEGIFLGSSYEFIGGNLVFEVTSGKKLNNAEESGITNYSVDFVQRVVLLKTSFHD